MLLPLPAPPSISSAFTPCACAPCARAVASCVPVPLESSKLVSRVRFPFTVMGEKMMCVSPVQSMLAIGYALMSYPT